MFDPPAFVKSNSTMMATKPKERQRSTPAGGAANGAKSFRRQSSSFANDASRKASFQRSDHVNGNHILSYMEENPEIQELRCEQVMGPEFLGPMHRLLVNYHSSIHLYSLELPNNELTPDAGNDLSQILRSQQQTLSKLDLSGNPLTAVGCSPILDPLITESFPSRLKILNLSSTQLGTKGATTLASLLRYNKSIQELYLGHNNMGTRGIKTLVAGLVENSTLEILDVSYNAMKKQGATILSEAIMQNSKSSNLRIIDVTCNKLGPAGMQAFAKLLAMDQKLEGFYAGRNDLGPEGATSLGNALRVNYSLKEIRLEANEIGNLGAWMLVDSLGENEHRTSAVEKIGLGWNDIGLEGVTGIADALKGNSKLRRIDLTGNKICCEGAKALAESLSYDLSLDELIVAENNIKDDGAYAFALAMGKPTCTLQSLVFHDNPITSDGLASLQRVPQLRRNLQYWLAQLLRELSKSSVSSVQLAERKIGDEELLLITDILEECSPIVRAFWLSGEGLSPRSLVPFFQRAMGESSKIIRLYLKNTRYGDDVARALSSSLRYNTSLEVLSLMDSSISAVGASAIAEGLVNNSTLRRLNLDRNQIGDVGMSVLGQAIPKTSLVSLSVSRNSLTDQSMKLECAKCLEELHMNGNQITDMGVLEFCRYLIEGCRLQWLSLRDNQITSRGGEILKTFLASPAIVEY
jgi:Ran GTPase-activating protein (RanGAP) involved in mRNA processing and transport